MKTTWSNEMYWKNKSGTRIPAGIILERNEPGTGKDYLYELMIIAGKTFYI